MIKSLQALPEQEYSLPQPLEVAGMGGDGGGRAAAASRAGAAGGYLALAGASLAGSSLSSPIKLDRLAVLADLVSSPEGLARLAGGSLGGGLYGGGGNGGSPARKRPRLALDVSGLVRARADASHTPWPCQCATSDRARIQPVRPCTPSAGQSGIAGYPCHACQTLP